LILVDGANSEKILERLVEMTGKISVGYWNDAEEPFSGTVVSPAAGKRIQTAVEASLKSGAREIVGVKSQRDNPALLAPCILDVTEQKNRGDEEIFGPVLNVIRVADFDAAIAEANNTQYGLSAGLISDSRESYEEFVLRIQAGIVNWNRQTTGASGKLPFGGCGFSGNHRPAGYYSADYAAWPMASLESDRLEMPEKIETGIQL
jgi:succinylglutamic semialdehyde dehydrogenase